jgi:hypothetical protein
LLSASAIPPPDKSGVAVVAVQQNSSTTLAVITRCGTLLLSLKDELDVSTAELVMNFTKAFMGEQPNMDVMDESQSDRIVELEEVQKLLYVLHEIASESDEAETVRIALVALTTTKVGQTYMRENPIKL